jgi:type IV secretion system protein VirB3
MAGVVDQGGPMGDSVPGYRPASPGAHRTDPARRRAARHRHLNGTLAGAVGLGLRLWLVGIAIWAIGHFAAVWAAKRDPLFVEVGRRHLRIRAHFGLGSAP